MEAPKFCYRVQKLHLVQRQGDEKEEVRFLITRWNHRVQNGSGAHPASYSMGTKGSFPGGKADHSPPSSAEVNESVDLYLHSPTRLHGVVLIWAQGQLYLLPLQHQGDEEWRQGSSSPDGSE
jgi:hypothetical protein